MSRDDQVPTELVGLLADVAKTANASTSFSGAVHATLERLGSHLGWPVGRAFLVASEGAPWQRCILPTRSVWWSSDPDHCAPLREGLPPFPPGTEIAAKAARLGRPVLESDLAAEGEGDYEEVIERGLGAGLAIPVAQRNRVVAVMELYGEDPAPGTETFLRTLEAAGAQLGWVYERKSWEAELSEAVWAGQRKAGELIHDGVAQQITGAQMLARSLADSLHATRSPHEEQARRLAEALREARRQVRDLLRRLLPVAIDGDGLMTALQDLVAETSASFPGECRLEMADPVRLEDNVTATHLFRIAEQAVQNAVRSADVKRIEVYLCRTEDGQILLRVTDDGTGLILDGEGHEDMGIRILRHRAGLIGAHLTVESSPEKGTILTCRIDSKE